MQIVTSYEHMISQTQFYHSEIFKTTNKRSLRISKWTIKIDYF